MNAPNCAMDEKELDELLDYLASPERAKLIIDWSSALVPSFVKKPITKPIKTYDEYEVALSRLDYIFAAEPGTPEFDEAELLTVLIEHWEMKNYEEFNVKLNDELLQALIGMFEGEEDWSYDLKHLRKLETLTGLALDVGPSGDDKIEYGVPIKSLHTAVKVLIKSLQRSDME